MNYISTHSPYYEVSGTNTPHQFEDARLYWEFFYSQNALGQTTYTMKAYAQYYNDGSYDGYWGSYDVYLVFAGRTFHRTGNWSVGGSGYKLVYLFEESATVDSYPDGTGVPISYTAYGRVYSALKYSNTYYFTPPTVQLNASLADISNFTIGTNFEISTNIYNKDYTNTLTIKIGDVIIGTRTISEAKTVISFNSSELSTIYSSSTNTNTPVFTFELVTTNSSGTQIGAVSKKEAQGSITNADPIIDSVGVSISTSSISGNNIVSGISSVMIDVMTTPQKSARITSIKINDVESLIESINVGHHTFDNATKDVYHIVVTDSRGNTTVEDKKITVKPYIALTANATFTRESSTSGIVNLVLSGKYWDDNFGNEHNKLNITIQHRLKGTESWSISKPIVPILNSEANTYSISLIVNDLFNVDDKYFEYQKDYEFLLTCSDTFTSFLLNGAIVHGIGILELYSTVVLVNGDLDVQGNILQNGEPFVGGDMLPIGTQVPVGTADTSKLPTNWLVCDGRAISRTSYKDLFDVIGTSYGVGDGSTTFNLPDKRGRVSVGLDSTQDEFNTLGKKGGNKINQELNCGNSVYCLQYANGGYQDRTIVRKEALSTTHEEINAQVSNLQPYEVDNWIIKAFDKAATIEDKKVKVYNEEVESVTDVYSCDYINALAGGFGGGGTPEIGTNNNGTYWKYPDGRLICFKQIYYSTNLNANVFYTYPGAVINLGNWAHEFKSTPFMSDNLRTIGNNYHSLEAIHDTTGTFVGNAVIWRPTALACTGYIDAIGFGYWK